MDMDGGGIVFPLSISMIIHEEAVGQEAEDAGCWTSVSKNGLFMLSLPGIRHSAAFASVAAASCKLLLCHGLPVSPLSLSLRLL